MLTNLRYVNSKNGILADNNETGVCLYLSPGTDAHNAALRGDFGSISTYVPQPEPEPDPQEVAAKEVRSRRDTLLTASDWTQVADAPVDQAAWATYRQALRDITAQSGFPDSVVWPTKPE